MGLRLAGLPEKKEAVLPLLKGTDNTAFVAMPNFHIYLILSERKQMERTHRSKESFPEYVL